MATRNLLFAVLAMLRKLDAEHMADSLDLPDPSWMFDYRNHENNQSSTEQNLDTVSYRAMNVRFGPFALAQITCLNVRKVPHRSHMKIH